MEWLRRSSWLVDIDDNAAGGWRLTDERSFLLACAAGHTEAVRDLLNIPAEKNRSAPFFKNAVVALPYLHSGILSDEVTPLFAAAYAGHEECVKLLLDAKASVTADSGQPASSADALIAASSRRHLSVVEMLCAAGAQVDRRADGSNGPAASPLYMAALHGCSDIMRVLLNASATVETSDNYGVTPLMVAAMQGAKGPRFIHCVETLLSAKANPNVQTTTYQHAPRTVLSSATGAAKGLIEAALRHQNPNAAAAADAMAEQLLAEEGLEGLNLTTSGKKKKKKKKKARAEQQVGMEQTSSSGAPSNDEPLCIICLEGPKTHAFVPCGHHSVCQSCGEAIMESSGKPCPICRVEASMLMQVFDS